MGLVPWWLHGGCGWRALRRAELLHPQLAWYIAGPILGLCVVACRVLFNGRLGVTGGYSEVIGRVRAGQAMFDWRAWFAIGVLLGAPSSRSSRVVPISMGTAG